MVNLVVAHPIKKIVKMSNEYLFFIADLRYIKLMGFFDEDVKDIYNIQKFYLFFKKIEKLKNRQNAKNCLV